MSIREQVLVELASVEVADDYAIELKQRKKLQAYTPEQAEELAEDLLRAAIGSRAALAQDLQQRGAGAVCPGVVNDEGTVVI
jgi:ADP-ribosylglycohydrolase